MTLETELHIAVEGEHRNTSIMAKDDACKGYFRIRDIGLFLRDTGIFVFFILKYGIFRNFGIWDIEIYFGIRVKLILGYGIFWTVYFGIWDIAYPPNQSSKILDDRSTYRNNAGEKGVLLKLTHFPIGQ